MQESQEHGTVALCMFSSVVLQLSVIKGLQSGSVLQFCVCMWVYVYVCE